VKRGGGRGIFDTGNDSEPALGEASGPEGNVISLATWILWVHILAAAVWLGGAAAMAVAMLPAPEGAGPGAARRVHFLTSRAMEVVILTGLVNVLLKGLQTSFTLSPGFFAMLSLKMVLLLAMAALQVWLGAMWRRAGGGATASTGRARLGLSLQCLLGAVAALLGLGLRAV
jgi:uncharacterized membrane protein